MSVPVGTLMGAYGSPIVQARTAWSPVRVTAPGRIDKDWPPALDADRLELYGQFLALIENRPYDVFERLQLAPDQATKIAIAVALPELLCNVWADALWGEDQAVDVTFEDDVAKAKWDLIAEANDLEVLGWESVFGAAFRGTSVLQIARDEANVASIGAEIAIHEISPAIFFPHLTSDRRFDAVTLAWIETREGRGGATANWHVREDHFLDDGQYVIRYSERPASDAKGDFKKSKDDARPDGVDFLPFVDMHAKRWGGRYWGVSELSRSMSLFSEVDDRLSDIASILDYHGAPMLQVPKSSLFGGVFEKGVDRTLGISDPAQANIARYITFDGMIDQQIAEVWTIVKFAMLTSEVPEGYFGMAEGLAESGTAVRLRLQNYLKKVGRWKRTEVRRLRAVADMALRLDDAVAGSAISDRAQRIPQITMGSPLPADEGQEAEIEAALYGAGLSARKTSIARLRRVKDVDAEIALIKADEAADVSPPGGGGIVPPRGLGNLPPQGRPTPEPPAA